MPAQRAYMLRRRLTRGFVCDSVGAREKMDK
jgi:hypothetical protein